MNRRREKAVEGGEEQEQLTNCAGRGLKETGAAITLLC
jgi:hypothetical protein